MLVLTIMIESIIQQQILGFQGDLLKLVIWLILPLIFFLTIFYFIFYFISIYFHKYKTTEMNILENQFKTERENFLINIFILPFFSIFLIYFFIDSNITLISFESSFFILIFHISLSIFLYETYFYWTHRFMHSRKLFNLFHKGHHKSITPRVFSSFNFDILEGMTYASFAFLYLIFSLIIFGKVNIYSFYFIISYVFITNLFGHLGINLNAPKFIRKIINMPQDHFHHHRKFNKNFGLLFKFWDNICNTKEEIDIDEYYKKEKVKRPIT